jgi:cyclic-di-GMP phosphodiesterase, flagellum assembly factor TipF
MTTRARFISGTLLGQLPLLLAIIGTGVAAAGLFAAKVQPPLVALGSVVAGAALFGGLSALFFTAERARLMQAQRLLVEEIMALRSRVENSERAVEDARRIAVESQAIVWRAAAQDIETLGGLVSGLAKTVAEHEQRIGLSPSALAEAPLAAQTIAAGWAKPEPLRAEPEASAPAVPAERPQLSAVERYRLRAAVTRALSGEAIELLLQPVVRLPQRRTEGYRAALRLKPQDTHQDVAALAEGNLQRLAQLADMAVEHDVCLIQRAFHVLRVLRARGRTVSILCPVGRASLASPVFLAEIQKGAAGDKALAAQIRLELAGGLLADARRTETEGLAQLRAEHVGIAVAMDQPVLPEPAKVVSFGLLQVSVPATALLPVLTGGAASEGMQNWLQALAEAGVMVMADAVTEESMVPELIDSGFSHASGQLFGEPRPVRPEVLEPTAIATAAEPPRTAPEAGASAQRTPFRSLLKRA